MRNIFLFVFLITGMVIYAQKNEMSDLVSSAFKERYPEAKEVKVKPKKEIYKLKFKN